MGLFTKKSRHILTALLFVICLFSLFTFLPRSDGAGVIESSNETDTSTAGKGELKEKPIKLVGQQLDDGSVGVEAFAHGGSSSDKGKKDTPDSKDSLAAAAAKEFQQDTPIGYKLEEDTPEEIKAKAKLRNSKPNPDAEPFVEADKLGDSSSKPATKGKSSDDIKEISDEDAEAIAEQQLKEEASGLSSKRPKSTIGGTKGSSAKGEVAKVDLTAKKQSKSKNIKKGSKADNTPIDKSSIESSDKASVAETEGAKTTTEDSTKPKIE